MELTDLKKLSNKNVLMLPTLLSRLSTLEQAYISFMPEINESKDRTFILQFVKVFLPIRHLNLQFCIFWYNSNEFAHDLLHIVFIKKTHTRVQCSTVEQITLLLTPRQV